MKRTLVVLLCFGACCLAIMTSVLVYILYPLRAENMGYEWTADTPFSRDFGQSIETNGEDFQILLLTDLHYIWHEKKTDALVTALVKQKDPDLIVLLGDIAFWWYNDTVYNHLVALIDSFEKPWTLIFGNHDAEAKASKDYLYKEIISKSAFCLFRPGPKIDSTGNYFITLTHSGAIIHSLFFIDTFNTLAFRRYAAPSENQVDWLKWVADGINDAANTTVTSTLFTHIPPPEYPIAYEEALAADSVIVGKKRQREYVSAENSGLFTELKNRGTKYIFCGHDHRNDYAVDYEGVRLAYCVNSGYGSFSGTAVKGGTLFTVRPDGSAVAENIYYRK